MKSVDQEKIVQLFETNDRAMRLPLAFPELSKRWRVKDARKISGVSSYQRAQVVLFAFGIFAAIAGAVLAMRGSRLGARLTKVMCHETEQVSHNRSVFETFAISHG